MRIQCDVEGEEGELLKSALENFGKLLQLVIPYEISDLYIKRNENMNSRYISATIKLRQIK